MLRLWHSLIIREREKPLDVVVVTIRRTGTVCGTCGASLTMPEASERHEATLSISSPADDVWVDSSLSSSAA